MTMDRTLTSRRIERTDIEALRVHFQGQLLSPHDSAYEETRKIWNAMIDRRPGLIALCSGVADVMTAKAVTVSAHATMEKAAETLLKHSISGVPAVDDQNHCIGMLSAFDFVKRQQEDPVESQRSRNDCVSRFMSPSVESVPETSPLLSAARTMCLCHVHRLPVLDDAFRPIGMVTALDIVAALVNAVDEGRAVMRNPTQSKAGPL